MRSHHPRYPLAYVYPNETTTLPMPCRDRSCFAQNCEPGGTPGTFVKSPIESAWRTIVGHSKRTPRRDSIGDDRTEKRFTSALPTVDRLGIRNHLGGLALAQVWAASPITRRTFTWTCAAAPVPRRTKCTSFRRR